MRLLPAAGADGHHGYAGGLLEHTVGVATLCRETAQLHPRLRADLLLVGGPAPRRRARARARARAGVPADEGGRAARSRPARRAPRRRARRRRRADAPRGAPPRDRRAPRPRCRAHGRGGGALPREPARRARRRPARSATTDARVGFAVLALLGAASWGVGDFFGGVAARRAARAHRPRRLAGRRSRRGSDLGRWRARTPLPAAADLLPALGAGLCGAVGLAALYRGMAVGAMGIVAPISAASPVVPLLVDLGRGSGPRALQWLGIGSCSAGIVLLARGPGRAAGSAAASRRASRSRSLAALGLRPLRRRARRRSRRQRPWTIVAARTASTSLALVLALVASGRRSAPRPGSSRPSSRSASSTRSPTSSSPTR